MTLRAYQIYLEHGFHPGNDLADWLAAEKELTDRLDSEDSNSPPGVLRKYARAWSLGFNSRRKS